VLPLKEVALAPSRIMIVDDNAVNLMLLEEILQQEGHEVRSYSLGRLALAAAITNQPDLILLDINMPEMDGYEVCERLKASAVLADIPVMFLSTLNDTQDKVKAFRSGAVDFISKPFQFEEVHARVDTHLKLHALQRSLRLQNERLEAAVTERTRELAEANERLTILDRSKSEFLSLISHEFRTPLNGLLGVGDLILGDMPSTKGHAELQGMFEQSRRRILSILDDALLLTQIEVDGDKLKPAPVSLNTVLSRGMERTTACAESHRVALPRLSATQSLVVGDEDLLVRAFHALLETAVKFSTEGESLRLSHEVVLDSPRVIIEGRGRTIPGPALARFFDLFSISEAATSGGDLGLGPPVAQRILSLFGASVSVANQDTSGIRFTISLKNAAQTPGEAGT
jgi:two-component system sensor histidine kinase/response regulator